MQFLVYLTVLMVSISTVLLEVHWLTSPPPQPKPAVQTANAAKPVPKVEGPTAALSPVYPKKVDAAENTAKPQEPAQAAAADQPQIQQAQSQQAQPQQPQQPPAVAQKPQAETTGMATQGEETRAPATAQPVVNASANSCDIQACASAYRSFRASDCTYQPFGGARRVCEKPPVSRSASRDPATEMRRSARDVELRDREDRVKAFRDDEDDQMGADDDSEREGPAFFLFGGRSRRW